MIATLRFNMDDEDDKLAFNEMQDARTMAIAITDVREFIRKKLKYENVSEETAKVLEDLRTELYDNLQGCKTDF